MNLYITLLPILYPYFISIKFQIPLRVFSKYSSNHSTMWCVTDGKFVHFVNLVVGLEV